MTDNFSPQGSRNTYTEHLSTSKNSFSANMSQSLKIKTYELGCISQKQKKKKTQAQKQATEKSLKTYI